MLTYTTSVEIDRDEIELAIRKHVAEKLHLPVDSVVFNEFRFLKHDGPHVADLVGFTGSKPFGHRGPQSGRKWSEVDKHTLIDLRRYGRCWNDISVTLDRTPGACQWMYQHLLKLGGSYDGVM